MSGVQIMYVVILSFAVGMAIGLWTSEWTKRNEKK